MENRKWSFSSISKEMVFTSPDREIEVYIETLDDMKYSLFDMHYEFELGIVYSGKIKRCYQEMEIDLGPGQIWLTGLWEPHGFKLIEVPCEIMVIQIKPQFLKHINIGKYSDFDWTAPFNYPVFERPQMSTEKDKEIMLTLFDKMRNLKNMKNDNSLIKERLLCLEIFLRLQDNWVPDLNHCINVNASLGKINPALLMVFETINFISTKDAAKACGMNEKSFNKIFKQLMDSSFSKFALSYRLREAGNQLVLTNDPIKKIVEDWGFTDESHFNHAFMKIYCCTPGKYRKRWKNK